MNATDLTALLPLLVLTGAAVLVMLVVGVRRNHRLVWAISLLGLAAAFASLWPALNAAPRAVTALLLVDRFSIFYSGMLLVTAAAIVLLAHGYLERQLEHKEEFYILVLLATSGGMVIVSSNHFASFFLGLEILSVALYALVAYLRAGERPRQAGIKYLVLASGSVAFMLFGMALIYAEAGSMNLRRIAEFFGGQPAAGPLAVALAGAALVVTGIGFKLALVPFHLWTPDVYEGAPLPVTILIATISKASVFGFLLRWFYPFATPGNPVWLVLAISAAASMLAGNLLALFQNNVKRILAYSSIGHMGYFLVAVLAGGAFGLQASTCYLVAYLVTITGAFGVLTVLSSGGSESCAIEDFRGLFWRRPLLAGVFTAMLLSLAGIPLTAGFVGKFYVMAAGAYSAIWWLLLVLIVSSVLGLFYYLRIVVALYSPAPGGIEPARIPVPLAARLSLAGITALLFCIGVYPSPLWQAITVAVSSLNRGVGLAG